MSTERDSRQGWHLWARSVLALTDGRGRMLRAWVLLALMCVVVLVVIGVLVPGWSWSELITEDPVGGILMFVASAGLLFFDRNMARRILGGGDDGAAESSSARLPSDAGSESGR